jgi:hypothetical protein
VQRDGVAVDYAVILGASGGFERSVHSGFNAKTQVRPRGAEGGVSISDRDYEFDELIVWLRIQFL